MCTIYVYIIYYILYVIYYVIYYILYIIYYILPEKGGTKASLQTNAQAVFFQRSHGHSVCSSGPSERAACKACKADFEEVCKRVFIRFCNGYAKFAPFLLGHDWSLLIHVVSPNARNVVERKDVGFDLELGNLGIELLVG